ncbi:MAG: cytochrome c [Verrucomicrobiaceae bacterium]|nr:cytochrome c [Verrucomicrobiaceae bacterium]
MQSDSSSSPSFFNFFNRVLGIGLAGFTLAFALSFAFNGIGNLQPKPAEPAKEAAAPVAAASAPAPAPAAPAAATASAPAPAPTAAAPAGGDSSASKERGKTVYMQVCFACHQPTGMGLPNMFPPLAGSDWAKAKKADRMIRIVLHGLTGPVQINGVPFTTPAPLMPPQGAALSDAQIADVLTYVRAEFGGGASAVTPEEVKAIREAEKARAAMWTEAELLKVPAE